MTKLTDTQLVALSSAAQREDRVVVWPNHLKGGAATLMARALVKKGLATETPAAKSMPVHRRSEDGQAYSLVITDAGLTAIGVDPVEPAGAPNGANGAAEASYGTGQSRKKASPRSRKGASKLAPGIGAPTSADTAPARPGAAKVVDGSLPPARELSRAPDEPAKPTDADNAHTESVPRSGSKLASVIGLLGRPEGATVEDLIAATGWLPHTTRAALTGLRKRGYTVVRERPEGGGGSVYRITSLHTQAA
jgi:Protein of unknown function (DUF3489)